MSRARLRPDLRTAADYTVTFTATQLARLQQVFATGVCDWTKPGVNQQPANSPLTFEAGAGGKPLGPAPASNGL